MKGGLFRAAATPNNNDRSLSRSLLTCDVGSLPFSGDLESFLRGADLYNSLLELLHPQDLPISEPCRHFEEKIIEGLLGKLEAGIDVPNFPQFRDMNEMFLQLMEGVRKTKSGYELTDRLRLATERKVLPELEAIRRNASKIRDRVGHRIALKLCVTGPYTLSSLLVNRTDDMFGQFSEVLQQVVEANVVAQRNMEVTLVSVDEPAFGLTSDTLLDLGAPGRETLLKAWEAICHKAKISGAKTQIHLHSTADYLFWSVENLDLIESHVDDPLYESTRARQACEKFDKSLKASIAVTDFDRLIWERTMASNPNLSETSIGQFVADTWTSIKKGKVDPIIYLETQQVMERRLKRIVELFGEERVLFAGPECGTRSFPNLGCALEYLRRVSRAAKRKV